MKKTYIQPLAENVELNVVSILAGSNVVVDPNTSADPNYTNGGDAKESFYDDDED